MEVRTVLKLRWEENLHQKRPKKCTDEHLWGCERSHLRSSRLQLAHVHAHVPRFQPRLHLLTEHNVKQNKKCIPQTAHPPSSVYTAPTSRLRITPAAAAKDGEFPGVGDAFETSKRVRDLRHRWGGGSEKGEKRGG